MLSLNQIGLFIFKYPFCWVLFYFVLLRCWVHVILLWALHIRSRFRSVFSLLLYCRIGNHCECDWLIKHLNNLSADEFNQARSHLLLICFPLFIPQCVHSFLVSPFLFSHLVYCHCPYRFVLWFRSSLDFLLITNPPGLYRLDCPNDVFLFNLIVLLQQAASSVIWFIPISPGLL